MKTFRLPSSLTGAFCLYNLLIILISSLTIYNYSHLSTNLLNPLIIFQPIYDKAAYNDLFWQLRTLTNNRMVQFKTFNEVNFIKVKEE